MSQTQLESSDGTQQKGKGPSNSDKVAWDAVVNTFCHIAASVIAEGHFENNGAPTKSGWEMIRVRFQEETRQPWTKKQLQNKWRYLKQQFTLWKSILGNASGIGWDPETGTIAADDDWWRERIKANPDATTLRYKKMPPWSDLQTMFGPAKDNLRRGLSSSQCNVRHVSSAQADCISTPNRFHDHGHASQENPSPNFQSPRSERAARRSARQAATPQQSPLERSSSVRTSLEQRLQPGQFTEWPENPLHAHSTRGTQNVGASSGPSSIPPGLENYALIEGQQSSKGKRPRSTQNIEMKREILQALKRSQDFLEEHSATSRAQKSGTSIGTCMDIVRSLPGVTERDPFYIEALMLLYRHAEMRDALVFGVHDEEARLLFLRREIECARKNGSL